MNQVISFFSFIVLTVSTLSTAQAAVKKQSSLYQVICIQNDSLGVRQSNLKDYEFSVRKGDPVQIFQGWDGDTKTKKVDGMRITFVKVQFPFRQHEKKSGWIGRAYIRPLEECPHVKKINFPQFTHDVEQNNQKSQQNEKEDKVADNSTSQNSSTQALNTNSNNSNTTGPAPAPVPESKQTIITDDITSDYNGFVSNKKTSDTATSKVKVKTKKQSSSETKPEIKGLNDPNCCDFPILSRPDADYTRRPMKFGAGRDGGDRIHAASDLYKTRNSPIVAVADGKVLSSPYYFYQDTYALEIKHTGGFIVRYGEITSKRVMGINFGSTVKRGQHIGYMGKVSSGCCAPMLHFELYSGSGKGSLSRRGGGGYERRSDLLNPTSYLQRWENIKFSRYAEGY